jgi:SAM-dependent methyltransferase
VSERLSIKDLRTQVGKEHLARYSMAAGLCSSKDVLDAGCGLGYGSALIASAGAARVVGLDSFGGLVSESADGAVSYVRGDAVHLPFKNNAFDAVVSLETLEHLNRQRGFMEECYRVLRSGGLFVFSTPNRWVTSPFLTKPGNPFHTKELTLHDIQGLIVGLFTHPQFYAQAPVFLPWVSMLSLLGACLRLLPRGNQLVDYARTARSRLSVVRPGTKNSPSMSASTIRPRSPPAQGLVLAPTYWIVTCFRK